MLVPVTIGEVHGREIQMQIDWRHKVCHRILCCFMFGSVPIRPDSIRSVLYGVTRVIRHTYDVGGISWPMLMRSIAEFTLLWSASIRSLECSSTHRVSCPAPTVICGRSGRLCDLLAFAPSSMVRGTLHLHPIVELVFHEHVLVPYRRRWHGSNIAGRIVEVDLHALCILRAWLL